MRSAERSHQREAGTIPSKIDAPARHGFHYILRKSDAVFARAAFKLLIRGEGFSDGEPCGCFNRIDVRRGRIVAIPLLQVLEKSTDSRPIGMGACLEIF